LADVGRELSGTDHDQLIEEARLSLRPRPRVLADFVGALRRRMLRILRLRSFAAASAEHTQARRHAEERRRREAPRLLVDDRPPEVALADFRNLLAAQVKPLHERTVIERARRLHAEGLSLLPLEPRSKGPAVASWKAFQTERMTLARLERELERLGSDAGLAEVVVVDFDDELGVAWGREHLPDTPWKTRTARGEHWYFRIHRGTWTPPTGPLPWKGELRAAGHYVVAPGSLHPEGQRYQAVGAWSALATCPVWSHAWLSTSSEELQRLREKRARILKSE
jgi:hypothetical protein